MSKIIKNLVKYMNRNAAFGLAKNQESIFLKISSYALNAIQNKSKINLIL